MLPRLKLCIREPSLTHRYSGPQPLGPDGGRSCREREPLLRAVRESSLRTAHTRLLYSPQFHLESSAPSYTVVCVVADLRLICFYRAIGLLVCVARFAVHGQRGLGVTVISHHDLERTFNGMELNDNNRDKHLNEYPKALFIRAKAGPVPLTCSVLPSRIAPSAIRT